MIEINLIPDVKKELLRAQVQRNMIVSIAILAAIGAGVVIALLAAYVYGAQGLIMRETNKKITERFETLRKVEDLDKMLTIRNQLGAVSSLNKDKLLGSRLYGLLNVVVPQNIKLSSVVVEPAGGGEEGAPAEGAQVTLEGQTAASFASLEVFEKQIAAAVIQYKPNEGFESAGDLNCGSADLQCKYTVAGGGDRSTAVVVSEMNFGENQQGVRTLYFKLSFTLAPEVLSNNVSDVSIKIGQDGNVTDSYLGVPRAIFGAEDRKKEDGDGN